MGGFIAWRCVMSDYEPLREVNGPYGAVEVSRKSTFLGNASFCVTHKDSGKYALYADYDDAMRKAYDLCGRRASDYKPGS